MQYKKILIDLTTEEISVIDKMAQETGRSRKSMVQMLVITHLKQLNYKPQLSLLDEIKTLPR